MKKTNLMLAIAGAIVPNFNLSQYKLSASGFGNTVPHLTPTDNTTHNGGYKGKQTKKQRPKSKPSRRQRKAKQRL